MAITNDELLQNLKQFINAKADGVENRPSGGMDGVEKRLYGVEARLKIVEEDLNDVKLTQNEILEAVGQDLHELKETQKSHENRVSKLETFTQAA